jgi:hypothetical protein
MGVEEKGRNKLVRTTHLGVGFVCGAALRAISLVCLKLSGCVMGASAYYKSCKSSLRNPMTPARLFPGKSKKR